MGDGSKSSGERFILRSWDVEPPGSAHHHHQSGNRGDGLPLPRSYGAEQRLPAARGDAFTGGQTYPNIGGHLGRQPVPVHAFGNLVCGFDPNFIGAIGGQNVAARFAAGRVQAHTHALPQGQIA